MSRNEDNGFADWGGYMDAKISKLEEQFGTASNPFKESNLFAGISIFVNGLTNPSADELKRIMMVHGGVYHHYQRSHTMYVIASNLPDVKVRNMNTSKIISAQWVVDCLKEKRILDYTKYLLYTNHKPSQPKLIFEKQKSINIDTKSAVQKLPEPEINDILQELKILNEKMKEPPDDIKKSPNDKDGEKSVDKLGKLEEGKVSSDTIVSFEDMNDETLSPEMFDEADAEENEKFVLCEQPKVQETKVNQSIVTKQVAKTAVDPNFLSEFYNNSRLHHIATLGAGFKQYVLELREKHCGNFPDREILRTKLTKIEDFKEYSQIVMHIDMDCFFVSVGLRARPHLRGYPIAVTHSKGKEANVRAGTDRQLEMELYMKRLQGKFDENVRSDKIKNGFEGNDSLSEIASCSYEARKVGVRNGMFVGQALKLCPNLKTIPYDFEGYKEVANTLYNTVAKYTLNIEAVSCDEMYVDLTELLNVLKVETMDFVSYLRNEVKELTGCPCSAGVGGNRLQARMATKKAKPDGQFFLNSESVQEYMANISTSDLPGVGYSTEYTLKRFKWNTCGDLQQIALNTLQKEFGKKFGETLYNFCRGIDNRPLVYGHIRKSVSAEVNYGIRFKEFEELEKFLRQLCAEVHSRLMDIKRKGKCITLKLMVRSKEAPVETSKYMGHGVCDYLTKSSSLNEYTCDLDVITKTVFSILKPLNVPPKELRGIGIQITKLDDPTENKKKKDNVLKAMFSKVTEKRKVESIATERKESEAVIEKKLPAIPDKPEKEAIEQDKQKPMQEKKVTSPGKKSSKTAKKSNRGKTKGKSVKVLDVGNMLQNVQTRTNNEVEYLVEGIDYNVLNELPEDIREEVLRDHKRKLKMKIPNNETAKPCNGPKKIKVDMEFLAALPPNLRKEVENEISLQNDKFLVTGNEKLVETDKKENNTSLMKSADTSLHEDAPIISGDNIIIQKNWRHLLQSWFDSTDKPEDYDIDMIAEHSKELIRAKQINDLYVPLKFFFRITNTKKVCAWHSAYLKVLKAVQMEMIAVYGSKMFLEDSFNCETCTMK